MVGVSLCNLSKKINLCVVFVTIADPMHNLFLGTTKHMIQLWKDRNLLSDKDMKEIQRRMDSLKVPSDVGSYVSKLTHNMSKFTAEEMKKFCIIFSPFLLHGILPDAYFSNFLVFAEACRLLCVRIVSDEQLDEVQRKFEEFLSEAETLYGEEVITANMHLHLHLVDVVKDWGPVYAFWLFPFERLNGVLGDIATNHHNVEVQLLDRIEFEIFARSTRHMEQPRVLNESQASQLTAEDLQLLNFICGKGTTLESADRSVDLIDHVEFLKMAYQNEPVVRGDEPAPIEFLSRPTLKPLSADERIYLSEHYSTITSQHISPTDVNIQVTEFAKIKMAGEIIGMNSTRHSRSSHVLVPFPVHHPNDANYMEKFPARVEKLFRHEFQGKSFTFAKVKWFQPNPAHRFKAFAGSTVEVWKHSFYPVTADFIIPINLIAGRFVAAYDEKVGARFDPNNLYTLLVLPLLRKAYF
jgi:hypothetical protein